MDKRYTSSTCMHHRSGCPIPFLRVTVYNVYSSKVADFHQRHLIHSTAMPSQPYESPKICKDKNEQKRTKKYAPQKKMFKISTTL